MSNYNNKAILPPSNENVSSLAKTPQIRLNDIVMDSPSITCQMLSIREVCKILGVGTSTVRNLLNLRKLRAKKLGTRTLIRESDLSEYINTLEDYEGSIYEF